MGLRTGLVIWTILISCHSLQAQTSFVEAWPEIRYWHLRRLQESGVVGTSFAIFHDGEVKAAEYHGYADLDSKRKVDKNTIYH